jgi:hypothetical protein
MFPDGRRYVGFRNCADRTYLPAGYQRNNGGQTILIQSRRVACMAELLYILRSCAEAELACGGRGLTRKKCKSIKSGVGLLANSGALPRVGFVESATIVSYPAHAVLQLTSDRPVA